jgi:uncharacterized protein YfaS (alpha-2-macroglobulin family)
VAFAGPRGQTTRDSEIAVVFDRPMRALGLGPSDPAPPVTLQPAVKGAFHWIGSSGLRFDAEARLPPATAFHVEIPAGTRALDGTALAEPFAFDFATPRPALTESEPAAGAEGVLPDSQIVLAFNQPVSEAEVRRAVSLHAGKRAAVLPFTVDRFQPERFRIKPTRPLPPSDRIRILVDASLRAEVGDLPAGTPREIAFSTVTAPAVRRIACVPHPEDASLCDPDNTTLTVELSAPVHAADLLRALVLEPPVAWKRSDYEGDGFVETVSISPEIMPGARVRLRVDPARGGAALADAWGQRLLGAAEDLHFGNRASEVRFGVGGTYWGTHAPHDFLTLVTNAAGVEVSARPYPIEEVLADLSGAPATPSHGAISLPLAPGRLDESVRRPVRLDDLLPPGARGPVQILSNRPGAMTHGYAVQLSDLAISARVGHGSAALLVTGLDDGKPVPGASIQVYRAPLAEAPAAPPPWTRVAAGIVTGADGGASVPLSPFGGPSRLVVVARAGSDWAYATLGTPRPARAIGVLYTERGLYRPGETVKLSGIFRVPGPSTLETPAGAPVTVEVGEKSGSPVFTGSATLSEFGTFAIDVPLRADLPLGTYRVHARTANGDQSSWFRVAEYRPTSIAVEAATGAGEYVRGQTFTCRGEGRYLHGGSMAGAAATLSLQRWATSSAVPGMGGFTLDDEGRPSPPRDLARTTATLDAHGAASFPVPLALPEMTGTEGVTCVAEITDLDRQSLAADATAIVHPADVYVALATPQKRWIEPGATLSFGALAVTPAGARQVARVHLEATLHEKSEKTALLGACDVTTGPDPVGCSVKVPRPARPGATITVRGGASDARGNPVHASYTVFIDEVSAPPKRPRAPPAPPPPPAPRRLEIHLSQPAYSVGATARIDLDSPFSAPATALVTVEREGILWQSVVPVAGSQAQIDVPVTHAMIPNADVEVTLISGGDVARAGSRFLVDPAPQKLGVAIETHGEAHAPGEEIDVDVTVTDAGGAPARAEVTLYAADEGTLSLANYRLPEPHQALFETRWNQVQGFEARDERVWVGLGGRHRVHAPSVRMGATQVNGQPLRSDFRQTAIFAPHLVTDAKGRVHRRVKLPDGLTAYRFMAVAVAADDRAGAAETKVTTSLPLMARASLPRVIRAGDRFEAAVVVSTAGLPAGDVQLQAEATGLVLDGPPQRSVHVDPGAAIEARFTLRADRPGPARLTVRASLGSASDAVTLAGEVVMPAFLESAAVDGETASAAAEQLASTAGLRPDYGGLEVTVSNGPLAGLAGGIQQLVEYPYGCTEQTVSAMVPLLALRDLARPLGEELPADTEAALGAAVKRVLANQRDDGGFGLWPESRQSQPWVTAWALWGLGEARRRGVDVPDRAETRGRAFLLAALAGKEDGPPADLALAAFLVDLAAEDGHPDKVLSARLVAARDRLPPFGQALLLHALSVAGQAPDARRDLARSLETFVRLDGASARAVVLDPIRPLFDTDSRTTAMILRAFVADAPSHPLVPRLARGLLAQRRNGRFRTTQDAAWALLALDALRRASPKPTVDAHVFLGPKSLGEARLGGGVVAQTFQVPMSGLLGSGGQLLTFTAAGGTLHYDARLRFGRARLPATPEEAGIFVRRTVRPLGPGPRARGTFVAGELVQVVLDVMTPSPRSFVSIDSPLPGGFEAADASLRSTGRWIRDLESSPGAGRQIRDDRVVFFADALPAGISVFSYVARASTPGTFVTPPARAEEMYVPETFGSTAAETTIVTAP